MMAILNRRQELPRDRADLYDQASRVLLYHWDVDHKRLQLPMDAIGRREKQEMLRAIAYEMQAGAEGLKGNLISAEHLTRALMNYLREQGFSEPREKANRLIQQLRERNFILCYRGADSYGFMHRTFLEYFCAVEIVERFSKRGIEGGITFEQLRDEVFGQHWQDETWHEVLRLICGMVDPKFAGELIKFLMTREHDISKFVDEEWLQFTGEARLMPEGLINLLLATDCFSEVNNASMIPEVKKSLLQQLQSEIEQPQLRLSRLAASEIFTRITQYFENDEILLWLRQRVQAKESSVVQYAAIIAIAAHCYADSETLTWLKENVQQGNDWGIRQGAVEAIIEHYREDTETFLILKQRSQTDEDWGVRRVAIDAISKYFWSESSVFELLCDVVRNDPFTRNVSLSWEDNPRQFALQGLLNHHPNHPITIELLNDKAVNDQDKQLREWAQQQLEQRKKQKQ